MTLRELIEIVDNHKSRGFSEDDDIVLNVDQNDIIDVDLKKDGHGIRIIVLRWR